MLWHNSDMETQTKVTIIKNETKHEAGWPGWNRTLKIELAGLGELTAASWPNVHGPSVGWFESVEAAKAAWCELPEGEADLDDVAPYLAGHYLIDLAKAGYRTPGLLARLEEYLQGLVPAYAASVRRRLGLSAQ